MPWLVGLPAPDASWDAPALSSPQSEPGTLRSCIRAPSTEEGGTVARRAKSTSPAKAPSLAWRKRLLDGHTSYGDQTDLFGPSGLENIFARTQVTDIPSQGRKTTGLKVKLHRTSEDSAESSPTSSQSSSIVDMMTEMMGKMNELSESNKGYQSRMQALKERFGDSEEWREKLEKSERERREANGNVAYQYGKAKKANIELEKLQEKVLDYAKQNTNAEHRAQTAKNERRKLAELNVNIEHREQSAKSERRKLEEQCITSNVTLSYTRQQADAWKRQYEAAQSELESLRSSSPRSVARDDDAASAKSEIITREAKAAPPDFIESVPSSPIYENKIDDMINNIKADVEAVAESKNQNTTYHTAQSAHEATVNHSVTESEAEDLTPVFITKRTTSTGTVHFNAVGTNEAAQADIFKQRKDIDKTETSHRAREVQLAMGTELSDMTDPNDSTPNRTKVLNKIMGINDSSIAGADDESEYPNSRHVSGFTDAPEVEEDMPVRAKQNAYSGTWDFTEPPFNESSELIAAHKHRESQNKVSEPAATHKHEDSKDCKSVSFGVQQLNDYAFGLVDTDLEDAANGVTTEEPDGPDMTDLGDYEEPNAPSRNSSPASDVQAPGSRMPFAFRKDSLAEIRNTSAKSRRISSKDSVSRPMKTPTLLSPRIRQSPPQESKDQDIADIVLPKTRSPPQVYVEDVDESQGITSPVEGKRPLPRSPFKSPTPKRRRTLHDSELQSVTDANVSYHSQLQDAISSQKRKNVRHGEQQNIAKPDVLAHRKIARARSATPSQGPATKDYINEAKKVIELLRGNNTTSSPLGGITEGDEDGEEDYEEHEEESEAADFFHNTHKSDNMRTLAPQQVAHLIGGEMHGMTFDKTKNCWIRSKSSEHKQFLDPRDALSSDDDPFREISDLTVEKSMRILQHRPSQEAGSNTVVHHEFDNTGLSFGDAGLQLNEERGDTPQQLKISQHEVPKLPGEDTTLRHEDDAHDCDPFEIAPTTEMSTPLPLPSQIIFPSPPNRDMPIEVANLQLTTTGSNANINNTFQLSDLPEFTVHEEDHERPSERALAKRLACYAAAGAHDPYTVTTTEVVKAITDVQGGISNCGALTSLSLHAKSLQSLHNLHEHCARVEKLDVSSNALTQLDGAPPFVRQLNARANQLTGLTTWAHLMHLQYLDISNNNLESLDGLSHLIHLRELRVDNNHVRRLDGIADLDGLITLSARNNDIREVNFEHFRFARVVELDLSENAIKDIQGLQEMSSLHALKLDKNPIGWPLAIDTTMPQLRHLSLRSCGTHCLDVRLTPNLRTLDVDDNHLHSITGLSGLRKLELLSMCGQTLNNSERLRIFEEPIEAQTIRLSRNIITDLQLDHPLLSVKHLELCDVGLATLPPNFGIQLANLRTLDISYNGVRDIRPLAPLSELQSLTLVGCRVERLRKTMATLGKLEKLQKLDMKNNPLTQGFYGPEGSEDKVYKSKLDEDTAIRRRTYELCAAYSCVQLGFILDGMELDHKASTVRDYVWERLVELKVLRAVYDG